MGGSAVALPGGFTAKTQREARLNPSETDLPRRLQSVCDASVFSASSANLAKIAHRGGGYAPEPARAGKWPDGPAITPLRLVGARIAPTPPWKSEGAMSTAQGASPQLFLQKGASQKRGQSVSDGVSRASFCVFAVTTLAVLLQRLSGPSAYSGERLRSSISLAPSCATDQDLASLR